MNGILVLLGTNLGDRYQNLINAEYWINREIGTTANSSIILESEVWGSTDQPNYLNQILEIGSSLTPIQLLTSLQEIEDRFGRWRRKKYGARILDLDILFYNNEVIKSRRLIVPHPQIENRKFTLELLTDLKPNSVHPINKHSMEQLLSSCKDESKVWEFKLPLKQQH